MSNPTATPIEISDLGDTDDVAEVANDVIAANDQLLSDTLVIVSQLDALDPRWTASQREIIAKAQSAVENLKS